MPNEYSAQLDFIIILLAMLIGVELLPPEYDIGVIGGILGICAICIGAIAILHMIIFRQKHK